MTIGAVYDGTPEVDFFSLHNRKNKHVDVDMLDYGYVAKSNDLDELKGILALLRSGKEGRYPQLEKATEDRILQVMPEKERNKILRMRSGPSNGELQSETAQLASWTEQMDEMHKALQGPSATARRLPPVRGQKSQPTDDISNTQKAPLITEVTPESKKEKKAIPAYDFRAWEKYNVEEAINDIDEQEKQTQEQARAMREQREKRDRDRKKELASLPAYVDVDEMSEAERKVLARVEKEKGNDSFRANENEEAALYYTRSMAFDDSEPALYSNRAAAHLRLKNFAQAEDDCTRAIQLDPLYCKAWRRRGMTRFRRGKYADAIQDFEHSLKLEPGNVEVEKLLKKTITKWKEVDGTVQINSNQETNNSRSVVQQPPQQEIPDDTKPVNAKPFTRFEIIEEDDEDDDENAPSSTTRAGQDEDDDEAQDESKPFQRFEIIEE